MTWAGHEMIQERNPTIRKVKAPPDGGNVKGAG